MEYAKIVKLFIFEWFFTQMCLFGEIAQNTVNQGKNPNSLKKISTVKIMQNRLINGVIHIIHIKMNGLVK